MESRVERICPACGAANPPDAHFCGTCAASLGSTALARRETAWPAYREARNAALAVGVSAGAIAVRLGAGLVRRVVRSWLEHRRTPSSSRPLTAWDSGPRTRLYIRRFWAVGDAGGVRHWGGEEITIEE